MAINTSKQCNHCKFFTTKNHWSTDGFDHMEDWFCKKEEKTIQSSVEWHEENKIEIPSWCPISLSVIRDKKINEIITS